MAFTDPVHHHALDEAFSYDPHRDHFVCVAAVRGHEAAGRVTVVRSMKSRLLLGMTLRRLASLKTGIAVHDFRQMTEAVSMVVREKMPLQRLIHCMKPGNAPCSKTGLQYEPRDVSR